MYTDATLLLFSYYYFYFALTGTQVLLPCSHNTQSCILYSVPFLFTCIIVSLQPELGNYKDSLLYQHAVTVYESVVIAIVNVSFTDTIFNVSTGLLCAMDD